MEVNKIICGDCETVLKEFPNNSIDTIITDPPYGLKFMGKKWDYQVPSVEVWQECLRVLRPGGTALIFAGGRTQHRMAVNVEDAGFILKDCIMWLYGSGFPKASDISKQIDKRRCFFFDKWRKQFKKYKDDSRYTIKQINDFFGFTRASHLFSKTQPQILTKEQWEQLKKWWDIKDPKMDEVFIEAEREIIGKNNYTIPKEVYQIGKEKEGLRDDSLITVPATPEAILWSGWKSHGLKPAYEPILVAIKPNEGSYANNALKYGVAGLNIDGGRIGTNDNLGRPQAKLQKGIMKMGLKNNKYNDNSTKGRFPANVILDEEAGEMLDEQSGNTSVTGKRKNPLKGYHQPEGGEWFGRKNHNGAEYQGSGGASRFFYCAKASKSERNKGCEGLPKRAMTDLDKIGGEESNFKTGSGNEKDIYNQNNHPTVKPLALMKYLCMITKTPTGGIVLDPFTGSGTTLMACKATNRDYIGIERESEYVEIAKKRINAIPKTLF